MRGGKAHTLALLEPIVTEHHVASYDPKITWTSIYRWQCTACGDRFQKRNSAPSCTIDMILQVDSVVIGFGPTVVADLLRVLPSTWTTERPAIPSEIHHVLQRQFRWQIYERVRYLTEWKRWRTFHSQQQEGVSLDAHEEKDERPGPRADSQLHDGHSAGEVEAGDPGDSGGARGPRHLGTLRRRRS